MLILWLFYVHLCKYHRQTDKHIKTIVKNLTIKKLGSAHKVIFFISRKSRVIISNKNQTFTLKKVQVAGAVRGNYLVPHRTWQTWHFQVPFRTGPGPFLPFSRKFYAEFKFDVSFSFWVYLDPHSRFCRGMYWPKKIEFLKMT
jgi:hypothetical protein